MNKKIKYKVGDLFQRKSDSLNKVVSGIITDIDKNKRKGDITIQWYLIDHTDTISYQHSDIDYMCNSINWWWTHYPAVED